MSAAREYLTSRAIDLRLAAELGVRAEGGDLVYPTGKRRPLDGSKRFTNPSGKPAPVWWLQRGGDVALVCEGESDALAALSALRQLPRNHRTGLATLAVLAIPGTGFPVERCLREVDGCETVYLAFDQDAAGRVATEKYSDALVDAGILPVDIWRRGDQDGKDVAEWLAPIPEHSRGEFFANLIADAEAVAPSLKQHHARRLAAYYREQAERWEQLAA